MTKRVTLRVKGDNIHENAPSMQQGLRKCDWGVHVAGACREAEQKYQLCFFHMASRISSQCSVAHAGV